MKIYRYFPVLITLGLIGNLEANPEANPTTEPSPNSTWKAVQPPPPVAYEKDIRVPPSITWENPQLTIDVDKNATSVEFEFKGTNTSGKEIKVPYVGLSCGCQSVKINKSMVEPNGEIKLKGTMHFPANNGRYEKPITVFTDHGGPSTLTVTSNGPQRLYISTLTLQWGVGDLSPKELIIKPVETDGIESIIVIGKGFSHEKTQHGLFTHIKITPDGSTAKGAVKIKEKGAERANYVALDYPKKKETVKTTEEVPAKVQD